MAKENEINNPQAPVTQPAASQTPNRDKWMANMRAKYGEDLSEDELYGKSTEGYDAEHEYAKKSRAEMQRLDGILKNNPNLADVLTGLFDGTLTDKNYAEHPELSEYAGRKNRKDEAVATEEEKEREDALNLQAFEEVCKEDEISDVNKVVDALTELRDVLNEAPQDMEQRKQRVRSLIKMITYDDAVAAAEIRGQNKTIEEQRRQAPKTAPKGGAGVAAPAQKRQASIFDVARDAE